jgi:hypothetical protein
MVDEISKKIIVVPMCLRPSENQGDYEIPLLSFGVQRAQHLFP